VSHEVSLTLAGMMPTAKLIELDTGHLAMLEQPAAVADAVRQRL
jgi:pimeloyl-ACP methyl ester carboxylesterase